MSRWHESKYQSGATYRARVVVGHFRRFSFCNGLPLISYHCRSLEKGQFMLVFTMAYWRRYQKCSAEASALAQHDSSSDEGNEEIFRCQVGSDTLCDLEKNYSSSVIHEDEFSGRMVSNEVVSGCAEDVSLDCAASCNSDEESDLESVEEFEDVRVDDNASSSALSFREELASWATKHHCCRGPINELLQILRKQGHCLPKDSRTLLTTPTKVTTLEKCGGQYIYLGIEHGVRQVLSNYPSLIEKMESIDLMINVDGLPLFKSSNSQFWPILGSFDGFHVFVIALFYGESKPNSVDEYLNDFLEELEKLKLNGIQFNSQKLSLDIKCFLCDAPARSSLKCIVGHTGYYACERCLIKGVWNGRVVFNFHESCSLRTDEEFAELEYPNHQKRMSPLTNHGISCVKRFPLDYMRLVCLGVVKRWLNFLKSGPKECKLSASQILQISESLMSLHGSMLSEFARQPRSLLELDRWKATEFRQFLLYTGPVVLKKVVSKSVYQHFLSLSVAISIMVDSNTDRRNSYLQYARELISHFVCRCISLYGDTFVVYNVHSLIHLPDDVEFFQASLDEISCFPFENHMQKLKRFVHSAQNPLVQVVKRLKEFYQSEQKAQISWSFTTVSTKLKDSCFLLASNKVAFVVERNSDKRIACDVISERHTTSFFENPSDSKLYGIVLIKNAQRNAKCCFVQRNEFILKCVCLPYGDGLVVFPMHHGIERC